MVWFTTIIVEPFASLKETKEGTGELTVRS
jgi:hypothetical protein